jgi:hypothetical protein
MAKIKVTALKDVEIYANVVYQQPAIIGDMVAQRPRNSKEWFSLSKNESRKDVSMLYGIHPRYLPALGP